MLTHDGSKLEGGPDKSNAKCLRGEVIIDVVALDAAILRELVEEVLGRWAGPVHRRQGLSYRDTGTCWVGLMLAFVCVNT